MKVHKAEKIINLDLVIMKGNKARWNHPIIEGKSSKIHIKLIDMEYF